LTFLLSIALQLQYGLQGTKGDFDLGLCWLTSCQSLEPEAGFDEILNPSTPPVSIGKTDNLIGDSCNERDEDHPRGNLIFEWKLMRNKGKYENAYDHDDDEKARPTSGMKNREVLHSIDTQHLLGLEGKDRFMLRAMIFKNLPDLGEKGDGPQVGEED
jgi:hypothetical protein